ncbi:hypothetical protein MUK42_17194 [Musa troglodytarum]|uniref:Uncharacterized protein n=1 Tax=Musa troglodytarum TaxID=320322 RepID=A0A9E7HHR4_9LILI|nr:hypothetical protein MUK42_17194 [Musa troglodytarum]
MLWHTARATTGVAPHIRRRGERRSLIGYMKQFSGASGTCKSVRPFGARLTPVAVTTWPTCRSSARLRGRLEQGQPSDGFRHARDTVRHVVRGDDLGSKLTNRPTNGVGPIGPETGGPAGAVLVALWLNGAVTGAAAGWVGEPFPRRFQLRKGGKVRRLGVGQNGRDFW